MEVSMAGLPIRQDYSPSELRTRAAREKDCRAITLLPLPSASPQLNPVERVWLYLRERYLSHRVLDDYGAVLEAVCRAWNKLVDDKGRLTTLTAYPYLIASEIP
jgi:hypothetical protein